jgi:dTDP-4-amino-4,6-dideoxygalactose transaminase
VTSAVITPTTDPATSSFERRFARLLGDDVVAAAFWKGRVALYALLRALGVGRGDEVVVPGFTCVAVPNAIRLAGAAPVYADIEPGGYNLDADRIRELVSPSTRALLVQHSFGIPARIDELADVAARHGLLLVEDCAHTLGGRHHGRPLGTAGDGAFFSFQWSKPVTTGLGGMAITRDPAVAERLRLVRREAVVPPAAARLRLRAQENAYRRLFSPRLAWPAQAALHTVSRLGLFVGSSSDAELEGAPPTDHGWAMGPYQEARGERLLDTLSARNAHADALAARYDAALAPAGWPPPPRPPGASLLRYPLAVADKDGLLRAARRARVELGSWFETPLHPVPIEKHARFGYLPGQCPNAERAAAHLVNLPLHPRVSTAEADRTARFVLDHAEPPVA